MIFALIPAYNEELTISFVVQTISKFVDKVIVVNDCSTDSTSHLACQYGAIVYDNETNLGYDATLMRGFYYAYELGASSVLTLDADGQHLNTDLGSFVRLAKSSCCHIVVGARSSHPRISESFISFVSSRIFGLSDITSGLKYYTRPLLAACLHPIDYDSIGTYLFFAAISKGYPTMELPINIGKRFDQSRIGSGFQVELKILYAYFRGIIFLVTGFLKTKFVEKDD